MKKVRITNREPEQKCSTGTLEQKKKKSDMQSKKKFQE